MKYIRMKQKDIHRGNLILVNRDFPAQTEEEGRLVPVVAREAELLMESQAAAMLSQLLREIESEDDITLVSGYRSKDVQWQIYTDSVAEHGKAFTDQYVALPGRSEHQTGLAIDLGEKREIVDFLRPEFPYSGICGRFRERAARFGFVERYGADKESVTGISHEPWHFRYVGFPHSQIMQEGELCLEEYIEFLKKYPAGGPHFNYAYKGKNIEIYYIRAVTGETGVTIPEEPFQISGNNVDGFVMTVWKKNAENTVA